MGKIFDKNNIISSGSSRKRVPLELTSREKQIINVDLVFILQDNICTLIVEEYAQIYLQMKIVHYMNSNFFMMRMQNLDFKKKKPLKGYFQLNVRNIICKNMEIITLLFCEGNSKYRIDTFCIESERGD